MRWSDLLGGSAEGTSPDPARAAEGGPDPGAPGRAQAPPPALQAALDAARDDLAQGRPAEARLRLEESAARHPRVPELQRLYGQALVALGEHAAAIEPLGRAVDAAPRWVRARLDLGAALLTLGRHEPAAETFTRALVLAGDHPELAARAHAGRGRVWLARGEVGRALRALLRAEALLDRAAAQPGAPARPPWSAEELLAPLADALETRGEHAAAQARWRVLAADPRAPAALRARAVRALDDLAQARAVCASAMAEPTGSHAPARLHAALAARLLRASSPETAAEALAQAEKALALAPQDPTARATRVLALGRLGRAREALAALDGPTRLALPRARWIALALAAEDRAALARVAAAAIPDSAALAEDPGGDADGLPDAAALDAALAAWLALPPRGGAAEPPGLALLAALAEDNRARRLLCAPLAPPEPPDDATGLLDHAARIAARTPPLAPLAGALARAREAQAGPLRVAILGEFNAGKSSLLNLLAGMEVAPVGATPTTATISRLRHGRPGGRVRYRDGAVRALPERALRPLLESLVAQPAGADERAPAGAPPPDTPAAILEIEIARPLPLLEQLELIDTPGLNATLQGHAARALALAEEADAVLWVFSATQAGKASEADALAALRRAGLPIIGVLGKADLLAPDELDTVRAHLHETLGRHLVALVPMSTRRETEAGARALRAVLLERLVPCTTACKQVAARRALLRFCDDAALALAAERAAEPHAPGPELPALQRAGADLLARVRQAAARAHADAGRRIAAQLGELFPPRGRLERVAGLLADGDRLEQTALLLTDLLHEAAAEVPAALDAAGAEDRADPASAALDALLADARARVRADYLACARGRAGVLAPALAERLHAGAAGVELAAEAGRALPDPESELAAPLEAAIAAALRERARAARAEQRAAAFEAVRAAVTEEEPLAALRAAALGLPERVEVT